MGPQDPESRPQRRAPSATLSPMRTLASPLRPTLLLALCAQSCSAPRRLVEDVQLRSLDATRDVLPTDTGFACRCGPVEVCGDGFDNNCDGRVDERCVCLPGTTQRCYSGTPRPGASLCAFGQQECVGSGEFGEWGECTGMGSRGDASTSMYGCRRIVVLGAPGANPSSNFQSWLERRGAIVQRVQSTATEGPLRRALLDTFDVAIIDWLQRSYTAEEASALRDWVSAGGGLIAMSGHDSGATADRHASLLAAVDINYRLGRAYEGPATFAASPVSAVPGSSRALGPVTFHGGLAVYAGPSFPGAAREVATVPGGVVVGITGDYATPDEPFRGRVFVFGDEWVEFDSEWSAMPDVQQLWFNAITWVNPAVITPPEGCE